MFQILLELRAFPVGSLVKVMSDFKKALMAAARTNLPWAEVNLVFFIKRAFPSACTSSD